MSESLGKAVLELDADATPLAAAMSLANRGVIRDVGQMTKQAQAVLSGGWKRSAAIIGVGVAVATVAAGKALYGLGKDFNTAYKNIAFTTGATGQELEGLKGTFKNVFGSTSATMKEASDAVAQYHQRLGLTGKPLEEMAKQTIRLSKLTGTDLSTNIETVSKSFADWNVPAEQMGAHLDGLFALSQKSGVSVDQLASNVQKFGPTLRALGLDFGESAAMFAQFEKAGINVANVMPGLKMAVANLNDPSKKLSETFKQLGIDAKTPEDRFKQVFKVLSDKGIPAADRTGLAMQVFGKRVGANLADAIGQGKLSYDEMLKTFKNGDGQLERSANSVKSLAPKWQTFKNSLKVKLEPVATNVFDGVNKALGFLIDHASLVTPLIVALGAVLVALGVIALIVGAQMLVAWLMALGPITLIIAAVAALAVFVIAYWSQIKSATIAVWNAIKGAVVGAARAVWNGIKSAWEKLKSFIAQYWPYILGIIAGPIGLIVAFIVRNWDAIKQKISSALTAVKTIVKSAWNAVKTTTMNIVNGVVSFVKSVPGKIRSALSSLASTVKSIATKAWTSFKNAVRDGIDGAVSLARSIPGKIRSAIGSVGSTLYSAGKAIIEGLLNGIRDALKEVWDEVGKIASKIKGLKGPLPYDRVLLIPEGRAMMAGLGEGIQRGLVDVLGQVGEIAPTIRADVAGSVGVTQTVEPINGMGRLTAALEALNNSGTPGVLDALVAVVNERIGYGGVGRRQMTAGDGRMTR